MAIQSVIKSHKQLILALRDALSDFGAEELNPTGATTILDLIENPGGLTGTQLMNKELFTGTNINYTLKKLQLHGYTYREPINGDKRKFLVRLTEKGILLGQRLKERLEG